MRFCNIFAIGIIFIFRYLDKDYPNAMLVINIIIYNIRIRLTQANICFILLVELFIFWEVELISEVNS